MAVPVGSGGRVFGAVRVSYPRSTLDDRVEDNWIRLGLLAVVVISAVLLVGWVLARSVTRPVRELRLASARVAGGLLADRGSSLKLMVSITGVGQARSKHHRGTTQAKDRQMRQPRWVHVSGRPIPSS